VRVTLSWSQQVKLTYCSFNHTWNRVSKFQKEWSMTICFASWSMKQPAKIWSSLNQRSLPPYALSLFRRNSFLVWETCTTNAKTLPVIIYTASRHSWLVFNHRIYASSARLSARFVNKLTHTVMSDLQLIVQSVAAICSLSSKYHFISKMRRVSTQTSSTNFITTHQLIKVKEKMHSCST
jgi:hypothetical protein